MPSYPPGLPIVMAGLMKAIGPFGAFLAVPLFGSLALFVTFLLGKQFGGDGCGLLSSSLLFCSPIFLFQLKEPMSDVPVTAWWLVAIALSVVHRRSAAVMAGLASSAAIMTRPNLVPLALILAVFMLTYSSSSFRTRAVYTLLFAAGVVPGCLAIAKLNTSFYGSPFESGYGSMSGLFSMEYLRANVSRYPRWLLETETPFVCLALMSPALLFRKSNSSSTSAGAGLPTTQTLLVLFAGMIVGVFLCYAFYLPFDHWTYLRFLLPAVPLILIVSSGCALALMRRLNSPSSKALAIALILVVLAWRWDVAATRGFQPIQPHDRRFALVGEFARDQLPAKAVVFTIIHSGSLRYYSSRLTVRWDWLAPEELDTALNFFRARGYHPYFLIEDWERAQFVDRFRGHSAVAALDWPPFAIYEGGTNAAIFDPDQREAFVAGGIVSTMKITYPPR